MAPLLPAAALLALLSALPPPASAEGACLSRPLLEHLLRVNVERYAQGSRFLLSGAERSHWVTAAHTADATQTPPCSDPPIRQASRRKLHPMPVPPRFAACAGLKTLRVSPAGVSWAADAAAAEQPLCAPGGHEDSGGGLDYVDEDYRPAPGAPLLIAGFPGAAGDAFRIYECRYLGRGHYQTYSNYHLDCEVDIDIAGMSGGAVVEACQGRAIGIVVAQDYDPACGYTTGIRRVFAARAARARHGGIVFELPPPLPEESCYFPPPEGRAREASWRSYRCGDAPGREVP